MRRLLLLFVGEGFYYQIYNGNLFSESQKFLLQEDALPENIEVELEKLLTTAEVEEVAVYSALNRFALTPIGFKQHDVGYDLVGYNASMVKEEEELMLSLNSRFGVQFYYTFPKKFYELIKNKTKKTSFNFTGEKFLNTIQPKNQKEVHINLYHNQCEFIMLEDKKIILYNNLDIHSEVDFLYFIMFTIGKVNFDIYSTHFYVYGEVKENETFISELQKFVKNLKIGFDNKKSKIFIFN